MSTINIGLFGFGVAGEGLYRVLQQSPVPGLHIKKIAIKHEGKQRTAPAELFTTRKEDILNDPHINIIVEATNDAAAAFEIASAALRGGKQVVSANKKMIATHFSELLALQQETGSSLLYESSVCAAIPIIRTLEEYYRHSELNSLRAIANGSCNYILTKILNGNSSYADALKQAQILGFAESDPVQDVDGYDAASKLQILLAHGFGVVAQQNEILFGGIRNIHSTDTPIAREHGWQIKQIAQIKKVNRNLVAAYVLPQFVHEDDPLHRVHNEYNGIVIENEVEEKQFFYGRGAGSYPTASALLNDVIAAKEHYHYPYKKTGRNQLTTDVYLDVYCNFNRKKQPPEHFFESIHEWKLDGERQFITGTISYKNLLKNNWWRHKDVSLILLPEEKGERLPVLKSAKKLRPEVCN